MLKWTVKKRLTDDALSVYDDNAENNNNNGIRKIHSRRSMGDGLTDNHRNNRNIRRRSLGNFQNSNNNNNNNYNSNDKENNGELTPVRRIQNRQSSTPLNDSSNFHKTFKRKHHVIAQSEKVRIASPTMSPISMATSKDIFFKEPPTVIFQQNYAPTLPSFDIEYSPTSLIMKAAQHNPIINKRQAVLNCSINSYDNNDEIPCKRLKFDALDMSYEFKPEMATTSSPLSTPLTVRKFPDNKIQLTSISSLSDSEPSLNSSEVGDTTLQQMIDDILASARHGKKFKQCFPKTKVNVPKQPVHTQRDRNSNFVKPLSIDCDNMEQKSIEKLLSASKIAQAAERTLIIADDAAKNEREVREKTPQKTDIVETVDLKNDESCHLKRQNAVRRKNTSNENKNRKKLSDSDKANKENVHHDSTIQKCLSFSSANYDEISEKFKRSSVASNSSSSSASYASQTKFAKNLLMKGSLELATTCDENKKKISIHVKRCKNLQRTDESKIHAYVKCALVPLNTVCNQNIYQRTAVHKNSTCPVFDHKFNFEINGITDYAKYVQIAVWHRNRHLKRSEFLGCLMISVKNIIGRNIQGSFLLQPQICLSSPSPLIPEAEDRMLSYF
ncbi:synaptotagmin-like protein 2 [Chironomus tepperi]|uniref:synaptotagmin-like protein 2 n=1 Tax=Chironomus tepperi TaxID=113505 RepID=UPI00391F09F1